MPTIKASPLLKKNSLKSSTESSFRHDLRDLLEHYGSTLGITPSKALQTLKGKQTVAVVGLEKTGQSSLFTIDGLSYECHFPPEDTQHITADSQKCLQWHFHDQSTWIDIPAALFTQKEGKEVKNLCHNLRSLKPQQPLSALVITLDTQLFLHESQDSLAHSTATLKHRIAIFNRLLGLATPVYLLLTKSDALTGFSEIFGDSSGQWSDQFLGFFLTEEERKFPLAAVLEEESAHLSEHLRLIEIKMLARNKEDAQRVLLGRFCGHQQTLQEQLNLFALQLLTDHSGALTNPLGGIFYSRVHERRSWFVKPLITTIIATQQNSAVHHTKEAVRHNHRRVIVWGAVFGTLSLLFIIFLFSLSGHYQKWSKQALIDISQPISFSSQGITALHALSVREQELKKKSRFGMFLAGYNPRPLTKEIQRRQNEALTTAIARPLNSEVSQSLSRISPQGQGGLANNFMKLKGYLRIYLAQSKAGLSHPELYDSSSLSYDMTPIIQRKFLGSTTPTKEETAQISTVVGAYIHRINTQNSPILFPAQAQTITATQERLVALFDLQAVYETTMEQIKQKGKRLYLFDMVPEANEVNMNSERPLHEAYTADAWQSYVAKELKAATTRINNVEPWLVGNSAQKLSPSITPEELDKGMKELYLKDVALQWQLFFASVKLYRYNSLHEASSVLLKLGSDGSALSKMFTHFTTMRNSYIQAGKSDAHRALFDAFAEQTFYLEKTGSSLNGLQKSLQEAGKGIAEKRQSKSLTSLFNGSASDPFINGYCYLESTILPPLPTQAQEMMAQLLAQPIVQGCKALKDPISEELNAQWAPLYDVYKSQFLGRYPFDNSASSEANMRATLEFFHPEKGVFWNTYNEAFTGYLQGANGSWGPRNRPGMIPVTLPKELFSLFTKADRIRQAFYAEGATKEWQLSLSPSQSNSLSKAEISLGGQTVDLLQRPPTPLVWPNDAARTQLMLTDKNGNLALLESPGSWGLMRLLNRGSGASKEQIFSSTFPLQLTLRTHARQTTLSGTVAVSSRYHPFATNLFQGLNFPKNFAY